MKSFGFCPVPCPAFMFLILFASGIPASAPLLAQTAIGEPASDLVTDQVLPARDWQRVENSCQLALAWLAKQQLPDGSFPSPVDGQPAVTAFCVLAFMSHGHLPGEGIYGKHLNRAINYILSTQKSNGILAAAMRDQPKLTRNAGGAGHAAIYNHAIASLLLAEIYGCPGNDNNAIARVIEQSLEAMHTMQDWKKRLPVDEGGWRYLFPYKDGRDSDLSVSGWCLMFLRAAKDAGFDVPEERIDRAVKYIRNCYQSKHHTFLLFVSDKGMRDRRSRGMAGAGILALAHAGLHDTPEAKAAGDWLLRNSYPSYNQNAPFDSPAWPDDRYHYGLLLANQAMYQLGGSYWEEFFPQTVSVVLSAQRQDGHWDPESHVYDRRFGNAYTTALMVITLGAPNQLLPIFQR